MPKNLTLFPKTQKRERKKGGKRNSDMNPLYPTVWCKNELPDATVRTALLSSNIIYFLKLHLLCSTYGPESKEESAKE